MKVALIGRYGEGDIIAGPERVARELYSELKKNDLQVVFIEYFFSGYKNSSLYKKIFGGDVPNNNSILRLGILPFLRFLIKERFEIIHITNIQRFILFLFLIKPFIKSKLVTTLHGFLKYEIAKKNFWMKRYFIDLWVERMLIEKSDVLFFPSKLLYETFNGYYKISEERCKIIPNGVSSIFFKQQTTFPLIQKSLKLVFYNGFNDEIKKGLIELIDQIKNVKYDVKLFVIGSETYVTSPNNLEISFVRLKSQSELIYFLKDKHFIIKSTSFDSFSIFVAESMVLGIIPIISGNVGIKEFIENELNGFIYSCESSRALAELINKIFENKYDLNSISMNAKKIYEQLNWSNISQQYLSAYQSVV